jgi:enoyl-CoA hydratase/carnithine racemase
VVSIVASEPIPGVRQLLLNRPDQRNALDLEMVSELTRLVAEAGSKVIVLGSTERAAFSAGADLVVDPCERAQVSRAFYSLYEHMLNSEAIIVASVTGHAVGGGAQLMIASDLRVASPDVSVRFVGAGHGLAVGAWGLPALVGRGRALDLILSMRTVGAEEAIAIGLIDQIDDEPLTWALDFAKKVAALPGAVAAVVKRISTLPVSLQALSAERDHNAHWDGVIPHSDEVDTV